jgi:acyl-ACP thioesterase
MELLLYEKEYFVHVYETGPGGKLNLYALFDFLQDSASDHAVKLGYGRDDLLRKNNFWVLSRIYAEIFRWPGWNERLIIKTWPRGTDKLFALRDFEVRSADGQQIAAATSSWLIIDRTSKRIQRPDNTLSRFNDELPGDRALSRNAMRLEAVSSVETVKSKFTVRISDLDINLHTNNARYLKWTMDTYPLDFILNNFPISAEINYLAESHFNEEIAVYTSQDKLSGDVFDHSIKRENDDTELCRVKILWKGDHS